jgi:hypothetical protein
MPAVRLADAAAEPVCRNCGTDARLGARARRQIAERQGMQDGRGMATAGILLGWVGIGFLALVIVLGIAGMASDPVYDALPFR